MTNIDSAFKNSVAHIREPFAIEAIQVTNDNMAELAKVFGRLMVEEDRTPYIAVSRKYARRGWKLHLGGYVTRMDEKIRFYSEKVFRDQFVPRSTWLSHMRGDTFKDYSFTEFDFEEGNSNEDIEEMWRSGVAPSEEEPSKTS